MRWHLIDVHGPALFDPDQASADFQDLTIQTSNLASCTILMFILSQFGRQLGSRS